MPRLHLPETGFDPESGDLIDEALTAVREHFGMPVAYLSRFEGDRTVFRNVSAPGLEDLIKPNDHMALSDVYCPLILSGDLPSLIPDTAREPACRDLPITSRVPIRSHISLPVRLADGEPYGMFCCLSPEPNTTLNERDLAIMSSFVGLVARQVQQDVERQKASISDRCDIERVLREKAFSPAFQPLVRLSDRHAVGVEALIRFAPPFATETEDVFRRADRIGLGLDLELATLKSALNLLSLLDPSHHMSINASPDLICDARFNTLLEQIPPARLVIEVTEHSRARDLGRLQSSIASLQDAGIRIAIDDVGAGYSDFQRITQLAPDILKLDRSLVSSLDSDPTKRAAIAALCYFAAETGSAVLAEGVETEAEASVLRHLGVSLAQGWLFGRPMPVEEVVRHRT